MNRTPTAVPAARARSRAAENWSRKCRRLGSPVRLSKFASSRIRSSACLRSVMSWITPCIAVAVPARSRSISASTWTMRTSPDGRRIRQSKLSSPAPDRASRNSSSSRGPLVRDHARPDEPVGDRLVLVRQPRDREALRGELHGARRDVPVPVAETRDALGLGELRAASRRVLRAGARRGPCSAAAPTTAPTRSRSSPGSRSHRPRTPARSTPRRLSSVSIRTGTCSPPRRRRSRSHVANPSMPGMSASSTTTSGWCVAKISSASAPSPASMTRQHRAASAAAVRARAAASWSTRSTRSCRRSPPVLPRSSGTSLPAGSLKFMSRVARWLAGVACRGPRPGRRARASRPRAFSARTWSRALDFAVRRQHHCSFRVPFGSSKQARCSGPGHRRPEKGVVPRPFHVNPTGRRVQEAPSAESRTRSLCSHWNPRCCTIAGVRGTEGSTCPGGGACGPAG